MSWAEFGKIPYKIGYLRPFEQWSSEFSWISVDCDQHLPWASQNHLLAKSTEGASAFSSLSYRLLRNVDALWVFAPNPKKEIVIEGWPLLSTSLPVYVLDYTHLPSQVWVPMYFFRSKYFCLCVLVYLVFGNLYMRAAPKVVPLVLLYCRWMWVVWQ